MENLTLKLLHEIAVSERFTNSYYRGVEALIDGLQRSGILEVIQSKEHIFYPKKLFREEENIQLYFFLKDKIVICRHDENDQNNLSVEEVYLKGVDKIRIRHLNVDQQRVEFEVAFSNGEKIVLSSSEDTNQHWQYKFYQTILSIYAFLN